MTDIKELPNLLQLTYIVNKYLLLYANESKKYCNLRKTYSSKPKTYEKFLLLLTACLPLSLCAQTPSDLPAVQWNFNGQRTVLTNGVNMNLDWVFDVFPTEHREYMCCGYTVGYKPVIFKLNKFGQMVWVLQPEGNGYYSNGETFDGYNQSGILHKLVKTPNGYAAGGYCESSSHSNRAFIVEVDDDGNVLSKFFYTIGSNATKARTLAMDPIGQYYILGGEYGGQAFVAKIDYATGALSAYQTFGPNVTATTPCTDGDAGGNSIVKIVTKTTASGFDIYATGYKSHGASASSPADDDNQCQSITNTQHATKTVHIKNKDIWLLSLDQNLSTHYDVTFDKTSVGYPSSLVYTETGPYSARTLTTSTLGVGTTASAYLKDAVNQDERGYDIELTQDGNLVIVALINEIGIRGYGQGNGKDIIESSGTISPACTSRVIDGGFHDPSRAGTNYDYYDEYADGDGYLLKINPSNGSLIWAKNVSHFSSKDFYPQVFQHCDGNFIVSGSTADYNPIGYNQPESYDALVLETPDAANTTSSPDHLWRKAFHAEGDEENMCTFGLNPTADGGFVICGDNSPDQCGFKDNFSVNKINPFGYLQTAFNGPSDDPITITSNTTWPNGTYPNNANIRQKVIVYPGATLTIGGLPTPTNIHFASSDHLSDYWHFGSVDNTGIQCQLEVRPGGTLILDNAVLDGIPSCHPFGITDNRQMWDGVIVLGDPNSSQNSSHTIPPPAISTTQGNLIMRNGSIIRDARYGTTVAAAQFASKNESWQVTSFPGLPGSSSPDFDFVTASARYGWGPLGHGGIVNASNSTWENCRFSIVVADYAFGVAPGDPAHTYSELDYIPSKFSNCTITGTSIGMAEPIFYAAADGSRLTISTMMAVTGTHKLLLEDNLFTVPRSFTTKPIGVYSFNSGLRIYPGCSVPYTSSGCAGTPGPGNRFENLFYGVQDVFTGTDTWPAIITGNTFDNNVRGIGISGAVYNLQIDHNTFKVPHIAPNATLFDPLTSTLTYVPGTGITLAGCMGYILTENDFNKAGDVNAPNGDIGTLINNAHTGDELVDHNHYDAIENASIALQNNGSDVPSDVHGLFWKCNEYKSGVGTAIYRASTDNVNLTTVGGTMREFQGDPACAISSSAAGNQFYNSCGTGTYNHLDADGNVTQQVTYVSNSVGSVYDPVCYSPLYTDAACINAPSSDPCPALNGYVLDPTMRIAHTSNASAENLTLPMATQFALRKKVNGYGKSGEPEKAGLLLESYGQYREAVPFYLMSGNLEAARRMTDKLPRTSTDDVQYVRLMEMRINLAEQGQSWSGLSKADRSYVLSIASTTSVSGYIAYGIADHLGLRRLNLPAPALPKRKIQQGQIGNTKHEVPGIIRSEAGKLTFYPNPTKDELNVTATSAGTLTFYNLQGSPIGVYAISAGTARIRLPQTLSAGIYTGRFLSADGKENDIVRIIYQP